jgi:glycosyltransferase involved in cell wall biosynthesis
MEDRVSIIVCTYNRKDYVEECIKSAVSQTHKNTEVIVTDGGSTDGTLDIIKKYQDKLKLIIVPNSTTGQCLNSGMREGTGDWVMFLHDDNVLYENAVDTLLEGTKKIKDPNHEIPYANMDCIDEQSKIILRPEEPNYNDLSDFERNTILLHHYYGNISCCIINKKLLARCGMFDNKIRIDEDYEMWLRYCILYNCRLVLVQGRIVKWRYHGTSGTAKKQVLAKTTDAQTRETILQKLDPELRSRYLKAVEEYRNQQVPQKIRVRRKIRDSVFSVLPEKWSNKITESYLKKKGIKKYHGLYVKDDSEK